MKKRQLGKSDLHVSEISLGTWTLGGPNWSKGNNIGWADVDENESIEAILYAIDQGVNHFDNADVYGNGKAERLLAKALNGVTQEVIIATKVGHHAGTAAHAYEPQHIRHQCEQSLINLKRECIDLYYFHHGDFGPGDIYLDDAISMMETLKKEGKIRALGLSAYSTEDFCRLAPKIKPDTLQGNAHILHDEFIAPDSKVKALCKDMNISFVTFGPLSQGILLDKYSAKNPPKFEDGDHRKGAARFTAEYLSKVEGPLSKIKEAFGTNTEDLARVALQYNLACETVGCVIPGFRNLKQVKTNLAQHDKALSPDDVNQIREWFAETQ